MSIFLAEDEVGFDANRVGFPTLGSCMGLVVQTSAGLYGFHNPPGHNDRSPEFAKLYVGQPAVALYSCARWSQRYAGSGQFVSWLNDIREIAGLLKFSGKVVGFNISAELEHRLNGPVANGQSAYCEVRLSSAGEVGFGCAITSNTTMTREQKSDTEVKYIKITGNSLGADGKIVKHFASTQPRNNNVFTNVTSNGGGFRGSEGGRGLYQITI